MRQLPENFFGWNDHKSIMLTKFATLAAAMGCVVMVLCGAAHRQLGFGGARAAAGAWAKGLGYFLLGLGYCSAALALWMLYNLYMFLAHIEKEEVFTPANVLALRRISWCCTWLQRSACRWVLCWGCRSSLPLALRRRLWR